ncbi:hypothetical protein H8L32_19450 [Undibacterium sp. CY18W]|uniref:Lipoprotein n=1 Tax=Undibacterium hunanense TaxID=2762292 RepID=A0ABR6ZUW1_9BURK|nr:hypothetical protein [Undibacterium hunanense]MBC3919661.1 hypothetical protein [Undibacterium hunanense]
MKILSGLMLLLAFSGCDKNEQATKASAIAKSLCNGYKKEVGKLVSYPDSNAPEGKRFINDLIEIKTASGFTMRLPPFVGGLGTPNERCEAQTGRFDFFWVDGKLVPDFDLKTGARVPKGVMIQYFVKFTQPNKIQIENYGQNIFLPPSYKWMLEGAFPIVGYEKIWVLPFANYYAAELRPESRKDKTLWRSSLLFTEVLDATGSSVLFSCGHIDFKEVGDGLSVSLDPRFVTDPNSTKCDSGLNFSPGAGGRIDIYSPHFLEEGAQIANAVIRELNSYIVKD